MKLPQTGRWQCGAVRYEITQPPQLVFTCHCTDCQPMTSSAFSMGAVLPLNAINLIQGTPQPVQRTADSGRVTTWWICAKCGSWVFSGPTPDSTRIIRGGTLDDTSWLHPTAHFFTRSKQPWITLPEGTQSFETQPADMLGFLFSADKP
jgi:hypothetical protein